MQATPGERYIPYIECFDQILTTYQIRKYWVIFVVDLYVFFDIDPCHAFNIGYIWKNDYMTRNIVL